MAEHKTLINQNILIPRGSTVRAKVTGRSGNVRVTVSFSGPGISPPQQAAHPAAWNNDWSGRLAQRGGYSVIVDVDFLASATVDADLRVIDPQGAVVHAPWTTKLQGNAGDFYTLSYGLGVL